jgi:Domain of unknown function (DUF4136)
MSPRLELIAAFALSALTLSSCATMNVNSYAERGVAFTQYHTYNWDPAGPMETGDPRLDNNPFFNERVQAKVETLLATRGFEKAASGMPELMIHYHMSMNQRIDLSGVDQKYEPCDTCQPYVYEAGTLLIDFVDTRTNKVVWRGWAEGAMDGVVDNQKVLEQRIDQTVARILETFPPKL